MGNFSKDLNAADSVAVRDYLVARANLLKQQAAACAAAGCERSATSIRPTESKGALCPGQCLPGA